MTEAAPKTRTPHKAIRLVVDYGGIAAFGLAYFLRLRFVAAGGPVGWMLAAGGHGPRDLTGATWWLMGGSAVSLLVGLIAERRLAPMPLIAGGFALVFGGLTLFFHDPRFIKIKPSVVNVLFGSALLIGMAMGRNPLKWLLGEALALPEEAWRKLILRYAFYFLAMAALNELVWRTQSDAVWVNFHVWGQWICVIVFSISQVPFMMKYMQTKEPPPPPTD
ncbi:MAG TPA: inner membrane-spanning protein YciB [Caulobacteraceae bacterium]